VPDIAGRLVAPPSGGPDEKARAVAQWVFESGRPAGAGTDSLPVADAITLPLRGGETPVGVLIVRGGTYPAGRRLLLDSFAHAIALAVAAARRGEEARRAELDAATERLRSSLLSSISHDFRTPLTAIVGSAEALLEKKAVQGDPAAAELADNIREEGERLSRLVGNLLEATRLESGAARLCKELTPLEEVVEAALERSKKALGRREVSVSLPEDLPAVPLDAVLMEQVFINLLENAARHTPPDGIIELSAEAEEGALSVSVRDRGPGIKPEDLERVFEKFHRGASSPGAGLGLAICRAVVNVHGGRIRAGNRPGGGAEFRFSIPLEASGGR
jgi:two-component system sensor histidine kinase KdpD